MKEPELARVMEVTAAVLFHIPESNPTRFVLPDALAVPAKVLIVVFLDGEEKSKTSTMPAPKMLAGELLDAKIEAKYMNPAVVNADDVTDAPSPNRMWEA
jgi:hypothetical protein